MPSKKKVGLCSKKKKKSLTHNLQFESFRHTQNKQQKIMRTKSFLLTLAVMAVGVGYSTAQSVYSVNAVGYVNKNLLADFNLISNPLNGTNNNLSTILPVLPDGSQILTWNAGAQQFNDANVYFEGFGWVPDAPLPPGQGAFLFLPSAATVTFVGEVPQGNLTNAIPSNFSLISHIVPQSIGVEAAGLPSEDGDQLLFWNPAAQQFADAFVYFGGFGWVPSDPAPQVGEGFFYFNTSTLRQWGRTFTVN
jgi:hypothetical protein